MPNILDLCGKKISDTYKRLVQINANKFYDGEGNFIIDLSTLQNGTGSPQNELAVYNESLIGLQDSLNLIFQTQYNFTNGSTKLYRNGLRLKLDVDYTESGINQITLLRPVWPTDNFFIDYQRVVITTSKANQSLIGLQDEINLVFTTPDAFLVGSTKLYRNGLRLRLGGTFDYTETGPNEITLIRGVWPSDNLLIDYEI